MTQAERRASLWQRDTRRLIFVFLSAIVTSVGAYIGTLAVNRLQGIQLDPTTQAVVVVASSITMTALVGSVILIRENRRLGVKVVQLSQLRAKEFAQRAGSERVFDYIKVEDVSKQLTKGDPELVVERWQNESERVRVSFVSSKEADFFVKVVLAEHFAEGRIGGTHAAALKEYSINGSQYWTKDFDSAGGKYFFVARRPENSSSSVLLAQVQVSEFRPVHLTSK